MVSAIPVPVGPSQLSSKLVVWFSGPATNDPDSGCEPLQPSVAVQVLAFCDVHCSVVVPPCTTLLGFADNVTETPLPVLTCTVTSASPPPPEPAQLSVKLVVWLRGPTLSDPEVERLPDQPPDAVHPVALLEDQLNVTDSPASIAVAEALRLTVAVGPFDAGCALLVLLLPPLQPAIMNATAPKQRIR